MRQEPKLFSSGNAAPPPRDGFHVEPRRAPAPRHEDDDDDDDRPGRRGGVPWKLVLAVFVLVVLGVVVWQGVGMLSGSAENGPDVPVFAASVDPFKHRPDDPGGLDVPNQNVTVYDTMDPAENADGMEQLLPAPEEPLVFEPEAVEAADGAIDGVIDVEDGTVAEIQPEEGAQPIFSADEVSALVDEAMTGAGGEIPMPLEKPAAPAAPEATVSEVSGGETATDAAATTGAGLSFSDVAASLGTSDEGAAPSSAPAAAEPAVADETTAAATTTTNTATEAPAAADGTYWVQIAAYSSRDAASSAWDRLARANADILGSATPRVMETTVAGTTLHRLQIGQFSSHAQAKGLCDELLRRTGEQCMIVGP